MPFPKVRSHEVPSTGLGDRAPCVMTAAHSSGSGEQMFGAE